MENTAGKGESARNEQFLIFPALENMVRKGEIACNTMFSTLYGTIFRFKCT